MKITNIDGKLLLTMLEYGAKNLEIHKQIVDELNVFPVPDGDTGTNMSLTFTNAVADFDKIEKPSLYIVAKTASSGALIGARGNSGVILSQLLRGVAASCKGVDSLDVEGFALVFKGAADSAYKAVMKPVEGTILTVARVMGEYAMEHYGQYDNIADFLKDLIGAGQKALEGTPDLLPVLKEAGVVDSGGQGLMYIIEGMYAGLTGADLGVEVDLHKSGRERFVDDSHLRPEDITYGYCTEFIIKDAADADEHKLLEYLNTIGDSALVIKDDDVIKVHVHTDHPGDAFEQGLALGPLTRMKVDNMREMVTGEDHSHGEDENKEPEPEKDYAFVAVAPGEGLAKVFKELGIDRVISGGQTMNPSTQDFLDEIKEINAKHIFLFPNNSNIILAANQAKTIAEKNVSVIPTKTIPQCVSAMLNFKPEATPEENEEAMTAALETVKTGEVTYAVRDTKFNGLKIKKNDIIGIFGGEIVVKGKDVAQVAKELVERMMDEDSELISIYYGADTSEADAEALAEVLEEEYEDCDIDVNSGGQPLYYYILSVE